MGKLLRVVITLALVAVAIVAGSWLWDQYMNSPWTRDGRIRADIVTLAPDVSGWVTKLDVRNNQRVEQGEALFTIDRTRYEAAVEKAEAQVAQKRSALELARHQYRRHQNLANRRTISEGSLETYRIRTQSAEADLAYARSRLSAAQVDLERTQMTAPADGTVINPGLREGNYVSQGTAVLSLLQAETFYVTGYFEETKLQQIHVGQKARMTLLSGGPDLTGKVVSITSGVANTNTTSNSQLLPQVQQAFNWVRLAQRIPVDIELDPLPDGANISAGMTVSIHLETQSRQARASK